MNKGFSKNQNENSFPYNTLQISVKPYKHWAKHDKRPHY